MTAHDRRTPPLISVIVPHLDDRQGLARCLASLAACRDEPGAPPAEIVIVDNGSRQPPVDVVNAVGDARLLSEPEPGPGPARNRGARLSQGEVLAFIDSDCVAGPGWLSAIASHFAEPAAAEVVGGDIRIAMADPSRPGMIEAFEAVFGYRQRLYVERHGYAATCNMAMRRTAFGAVGPFAGIGIAEDADWGRRAISAGFRIAFLPGMQVSTPARPDWPALTRKWERMIAHAHAGVRPTVRGRVRWIVTALAVALSPLAELPRIALSDRLPNARARVAAAICMARIRLWRARRMLALSAGTARADARRVWRS